MSVSAPAIPGDFLTTAMGVMPHKAAERALETALSMDIPFWPQLPNLSYYEDMYVQASENFPGIVLDMDNRKLSFSMDRFMVEYETAAANEDNPDYFDISPGYSEVYHRFLNLDLADRPAIRGQLEGPISFGLNVLDQDDRPILFDDTIRPYLFEFLARRINVQLDRLAQLNSNAFMFVDEPGLQFIFSALSGYDSLRAKTDLETFFAGIERPRGIHLCGNPDWDFMLSLDLDILSLDVFTNALVFGAYAGAVKRFLERGGVIVWGIVPANVEPFEAESINSLKGKLEEVWDTLYNHGVDREMLIAQGLLSPATCCLVNPDGAETVDKAFNVVRQLSKVLRDEYVK